MLPLQGLPEAIAAAGIDPVFVVIILPGPMRRNYFLISKTFFY